MGEGARRLLADCAFLCSGHWSPKHTPTRKKSDSPLDKAIDVDRGRIRPHKVTSMRQALMARSRLQ